MAAPALDLRIVGVSIPDVSDWREPVPAGKWSQFFAALAARSALTGVVQPALPRAAEYVNLARSIAPGRARWLAKAGFNPRRLAAVNAVLARELRERAGSFELIVQLQTLCSPRSDAVRAPYVIYTDNTMALTQRHRPQFAPLPPRLRDRWLAFEAEVCRGAATVFTYSRFARDSVLEDYGCDPARVLAVGAGANQLAPEVPADRERAPRALFVGRPFEPKGGRVLLEAWGRVRARLPEATLAIAGPKRDPGCGAGVEFLGRLDRAQLEREYRRATVFVLPSLYDAWGHVFVEAMGYGLPCIGTDCCAMPEIIDAGRTGLLVPRGQPEPLADALVALLGDPARARTMGAAGHAKVLEELSWTHVADRVVSHIASLELGA